MYRVVTLLLVIFFSSFVYSNVNVQSEAANEKKSLAVRDVSPAFISIEKNWQFCPIQNYQPDIDINILKCSSIILPGGWEKVTPGYDGFGLLLSYFELTEDYQKKSLGVFIERIRDADKVFINGHFVGQTGEFPPNFDKAVLYSRLYQIPYDILKFDQPNEIKIWVYNDARPGGITHGLPIIGEHVLLQKAFYENNYQAIAFIVVLGVFAVLHLVYFLFHQRTRENLFYAIFLFVWCGYLYTYSNLALSIDVSRTLLFRINIACFFTIFILFPLFIYSFFQQKLPDILKYTLIGISILIPFCFLLPEPYLLYYPLQLVELVALPALIIVYWTLIKAMKAKLPYAKIMSAVLFFYMLLGSIDIMIDFLQSTSLSTVNLHGPWALLILSIVLTLIISHKNLVYYQDATTDKLTGALRKSEFYLRLQQEFFRADRERKLMVVMMIDLDKFKQFNDHYGHILGDRVLKMVASCVSEQLRHFDLFCRYGGDEFCIAATLDNSKEVESFVLRIHQSVNALGFEKKGFHEKIRATFGVALREVNQDISAENLVELADDALISGKQKARGELYWKKSENPAVAVS